MTEWIVRHRRTREQLVRVTTLDDAINYIRANGLRVWGTNQTRRVVDVVENENLTRKT
jgi:hypothetical protein